MAPLSSKPLIAPIVKHNREVQLIPATAFLATYGVIVPIFSLTVLPLSITYQLGKAICNYASGKDPSRETKWSYDDSGYKVKPEELKPQNERSYDVVVLGATGFTGGLAVRYLVQTYGVFREVKWAIAGRSQKKLNSFKEKLSKELQDNSVLDIPTIIVDTTKPSSMPALVQDTKVVATTAGPYSYYGSPVVEFCAKFGTSYVDLTGEVDWAKQMASRYHSTAQQTGAKIIPFCGHDSIPWDIMVAKLQEELDKQCGDKLQSVNMWDEIEGDFAGGTLATLIAGMEGELPNAPKTSLDIFQRTPDGNESAYRTIQNLPIVPEKVVSPWDQAGDSKRWAVPFFMAQVNADVVAWSQALRQAGSTNLTYSEKWVLTDFKTAATIYATMSMLIVSLLNPLTLGLAKRFFTQPGSGPSMEVMEKKHFLQVAAEGVGEQGNRVLAMMYFPKDPGCMETSRMMIESALCLALESDSLPKQDGGFWSPSTGLGNVVLKRLLNTGTTLDIRVIRANK